MAEVVLVIQLQLSVLRLSPAIDGESYLPEQAREGVVNRLLSVDCAVQINTGVASFFALFTAEDLAGQYCTARCPCVSFLS